MSKLMVYDGDYSTPITAEQLTPATPEQIKSAHPKCGECKWWLGEVCVNSDSDSCASFKLRTDYCNYHEAKEQR